MPLEIERKFRVHDFPRSTIPVRISQGYLSTDPERTVRVRSTTAGRGYLTVKGLGDATGTSRYEFETEIDFQEAEELLVLCSNKIIKDRYLLEVGDHEFEVDVFLGDNEGLIVAEIELSDADEKFQRPTWLGKEVTGDPKYYNSALLTRPFKDWSMAEQVEKNAEEMLQHFLMYLDRDLSSKPFATLEVGVDGEHNISIVDTAKLRILKGRGEHQMHELHLRETGGVFLDLLRSQTSLGPDFEKVLADNWSDLLAD